MFSSLKNNLSRSSPSSLVIFRIYAFSLTLRLLLRGLLPFQLLLAVLSFLILHLFLCCRTCASISTLWIPKALRLCAKVAWHTGFVTVTTSLKSLTLVPWSSYGCRSHIVLAPRLIWHFLAARRDLSTSNCSALWLDYNLCMTFQMYPFP